MKLHFLGGSHEVGRSAVLLETDKRILMDYGIKLGERTEYPMPTQGFIDAFIPTHAHLDHSGASPVLYDYNTIPCFATFPTHALSYLLIQDSMKIAKQEGQHLPYSLKNFRKFQSSSIPIGYHQQFPLSTKTSFTLHDAGHIPGSAMVEINAEKRRFFYTADFKMEETRLHSGAEHIEKVDTLVIESTYSQKEHPPRPQSEKLLIQEIRKTLANGGTALLPSFAVGRSQELLLILAKHLPKARVFLDGMSRAATQIALDYPSYIRDGKALREAARNAEWVEGEADRRRALREPSVIVSSAGMLEGGPALGYLLRLPPHSKIILTGFQIPGTNAERLLKERTISVNGLSHKVTHPVEYIDFSAHAGRSDLLSFIRNANPEKIFCVHGDECDKFVEDLKGMGFDATAPVMGESFEI